MPTVLKQLALHPWRYYKFVFGPKESGINYRQYCCGPIHHLFCLETEQQA